MKKAGLAFMVMAALSMTACGSTIPVMTEEQNGQIVEYAAGLLLEYDQNYHGRLVDEPETEETPVLEEMAPEEQVQAENIQQEPPIADEIQEEVREETPVVDVSEDTVTYSSIEQFYGIDDISISYTGYEVKDTYPDRNEEEVFLAMGATDGCKLVVLNFDVTNTGSQDKNLDMVSIGAKFKVSINGASPRYALTTMLLNDLSSYIGTIASGASERLVLIVEMPEEETQSIQSISLVMKNVAENATISLN